MQRRLFSPSAFCVEIPWYENATISKLKYFVQCMLRYCISILIRCVLILFESVNCGKETLILAENIPLIIIVFGKGIRADALVSWHCRRHAITLQPIREENGSLRVASLIIRCTLARGAFWPWSPKRKDVL